mmetsp:Transcript_37854/g.100122  ORF Transcript_37854/g.100122 Transcript_37854/m.100122 type:complete len:264 (-) Transcript_37854:206-997(-)
METHTTCTQDWKALNAARNGAAPAGARSSGAQLSDLALSNLWPARTPHTVISTWADDRRGASESAFSFTGQLCEHYLRVVRREGAEGLRERRALEEAVHADRDGARDFAGDKAADDAKHRRTPVLQLREALALELLCIHLRGQANWVPEVLEAFERARRAAGHVVRLDLPLALVFDDEDRTNNLELAHLGHCLPLLHGATRRSDVGKRRARLPRRAVAGEVNALVAVLDGELVARGHQPAGEGGHRDAAVLQLGVAEPGERRR